MTVDHARIQMASSSRDDLPHRKSVAHEAPRVVVRLQVPGENCHRSARRKAAQRFFEQRRLSGTRRTDEIDAENVLLAVALAQLRRQPVILVEDFFLYDFSHGSSNSRYAISNSVPPIQVLRASPHLGQVNSHFLTTNSSPHARHFWRRGHHSISSLRCSSGVFRVNASHAKARASRSTLESSPMRTPTAANRASGRRRASASIESMMEEAIPTSCNGPP